MRRYLPLLLLSCTAFAEEPINMHYGKITTKSQKITKQANAELSEHWWNDAVFYQIFPRSFFDSNGDGVGDLRGITEKLDTLNSTKPGDTASLGVNAIWLTPIFDSPSYHGYDVRDYFHLQKEFGSLADFRALMTECDKRGIRVVLDLMLNHTSSEHPWFIESVRNETSPKRNWYLWRKTDPGWTRPWSDKERVWNRFGPWFYYALFSPDMPDLNFANRDVQREFVEIAKFWLGMGVAGFRLDAIKHLLESADGKLEHVPQTHAVLKNFIAEVRRDYPDALFVGEIWDGPDSLAQYFDGSKELDLAFDFNSSGGILRSVLRSDPTFLLKSIDENRKFLPSDRVAAPILTNHDMDRTATILKNNTAQMKLAAGLLLAMPGTPFVYYGEEVGAQNSAAVGDLAKRAPLEWGDVAKQIAKPESLRNYYRKLIAVRRENAALRKGVIRAAWRLENRPEIFVLERTFKGQTALVVANFSNEAAIDLAIPASLEGRQVFPETLPCAKSPQTSAACTFTGKAIRIDKLEAQGVRYFVFDS